MSKFDLNNKIIKDKYNLDKEIYEGFTVRKLIEDLNFIVEIIMKGNNGQKPFSNKKELNNWIAENQPYYKNAVPEVVNYFCR